MAASSIKITPITPVIGAVVEGVVLAEELREQEVQAIKEALVEHQVLFFRNQPLSPQQHHHFAKRFGDPHCHPVYPCIPETPQIMVLDTDSSQPPNNGGIWHTDATFLDSPPLASVLAAKHIPPIGGDTSWASGIAAYEALSKPMQSLLHGLRAEHDFVKMFASPLGWRGEQTDQEALGRWDEAKRAHPPLLHPVVRTHPESGRKALFVNEGFTTRIVDLHPKESDALLPFLFAHTTHHRFCVRWRWQENDVAFWDNRVTQHSVLPDYLPHRRVMYRATILGDKPF